VMYAKFGDSFSRFDFFVRYRQTGRNHRQNITEANDRYTHATTVEWDVLGPITMSTLSNTRRNTKPKRHAQSCSCYSLIGPTAGAYITVERLNNDHEISYKHCINKPICLVVSHASCISL